MSQHEERRLKRHGVAFGLVVGGVIGVLGVLLVGSVFSSTAIAAAGRHGFGLLHGRHGRELIPEHVDFAAEYVLRRLNASEEQQARVKAILQDSVSGLKGLREEHLANREILFDALSGATVDADRIEASRKAQMALVEEASKRIATTIVEVARTLTPSQRAELVSHIRRADR